MAPHQGLHYAVAIQCIDTIVNAQQHIDSKKRVASSTATFVDVICNFICDSYPLANITN